MKTYLVLVFMLLGSLFAGAQELEWEVSPDYYYKQISSFQGKKALFEKLDSSLNNRLDPITKQWELFVKNTYEYDTLGRLLTERRYRQTPDKSALYEWAIYSYTFNNQGLITQRTTQLYDINAGKWDSSQKFLYSFDTQNRLVTTTLANWNADSAKFLTANRVDVTYTTSGQVLSEDGFLYNSGNWAPYYERDYYYKSDGRKDSLIVRYNFGGSWTDPSRTTYFYDGQDDLDRTEDHHWDSDSGYYVLSSIIDFTLDQNGNPVRYEITNFNKGNLLNYSRYDQTYDLSVGIEDVIMYIENLLPVQFKNKWIKYETFNRKPSDTAWTPNTDQDLYYSQISINTTMVRNTEKLDLSLYPNPANNRVELDLSGTYFSGSMEVLSQAGKLLRSQEVSGNRIGIDVSDLPTGVYWLHLAGEDGQVYRKRLVVFR